MDNLKDIPIQLISSCNTLGVITPLRFRYEDSEHQLTTIQIDQILSSKNISYSGIHEILFTCSAHMNGLAHIFELKYNISGHKWRIFRLLS